MNGVRAEGFAVQAGGAGVQPALLAGRAPEHADEIVLGTQTLRAADARRRRTRCACSIGNESRRFRVVGRAVFPDVGDIGQLGRGAYLTFDAVDGVGGTAPHNVVLVKFAADADRAAQVAALTHAIAPLPVTSAALPRDLASFGRVDGLPIAVAAILGVMAGAVLVYTLLTAIRRRRRDLAVLKSLGFLRRDVARTVTVQAMTLAALAVVIGLPVGVVLGRFVWQRFADWQGIPSVPTVSVLGAGARRARGARGRGADRGRARPLRGAHRTGRRAARRVGAERVDAVDGSVDGLVDERDPAPDRRCPGPAPTPPRWCRRWHRRGRPCSRTRGRRCAPDDEVETGAVVVHLEEQRALVLPHGDHRLRRRHPRASPRSAAPRGSRSRPPPRPAAGTDRCRRPRPRWAARPGPAAADSASASPRSISSGG